MGWEGKRGTKNIATHKMHPNSVRFAAMIVGQSSDHSRHLTGICIHFVEQTGKWCIAQVAHTPVLAVIRPLDRHRITGTILIEAGGREGEKRQTNKICALFWQHNILRPVG